nr:NlpC/P60 family protein [Saccharopolyspora sp. HNM0983]
MPAVALSAALTTALPTAAPADELDGDATPAGVDRLADELAEAEARLTSSQARVEVRMEEANKARVDVARADRDHERARGAADAAAAEASAAAGRVERQRERLDEFTANTYRHGRTFSTASIMIGSNSPRDALDRAALLDVLSVTEHEALDGMRQARIDQADKDARSRAALAEAERGQAAAHQAGQAADRAHEDALAAQQAEVDRTESLRADKRQLEARLAAIRGHGSGSAQAAAAGTGTPSQNPAVESAVERALSQLGVPYAWGGGNASGPTRGIRDGGVADAHGDYGKVGFDCSGLMIYAFAGAGVRLDHSSGYQYEAGRKVPLSQMQRGDMLFWQEGGTIHHVALYLGDGQMVEAPYSGSEVRVTAVRYGGMSPNAVRLL